MGALPNRTQTGTTARLTFSFPNVSRGQTKKFIGCGEIHHLLGAAPIPLGGSALSTDDFDRDPVDACWQRIDPCASEAAPRLYYVPTHLRFADQIPYDGASSNLAILLSLFASTSETNMRWNMLTGDIWCTGAIRIVNGIALIREVDATAFETKLRAFIRSHTCSKIFIVPWQNMPHEPHLELRVTDGVRVFDLASAVSCRDWSQKTVVCCHQNEIGKLVELFFDVAIEPQGASHLRRGAHVLRRRLHLRGRHVARRLKPVVPHLVLAVALLAYTLFNWSYIVAPRQEPIIRKARASATQAYIQWKAGNLDAALETLTQAQAALADEPELARMKGYISLGKGDSYAAYQAFTAARALAPNLPQASWDLVLLHFVARDNRTTGIGDAAVYFNDLVRLSHLRTASGSPIELPLVALQDKESLRKFLDHIASNAAMTDENRMVFKELLEDLGLLFYLTRRYDLAREVLVAAVPYAHAPMGDTVHRLLFACDVDSDNLGMATKDVERYFAPMGQLAPGGILRANLDGASATLEYLSHTREITGMDAPGPEIIMKTGPGFVGAVEIFDAPLVALCRGWSYHRLGNDEAARTEFQKVMTETAWGDDWSRIIASAYTKCLK